MNQYIDEVYLVFGHLNIVYQACTHKKYASRTLPLTKQLLTNNINIGFFVSNNKVELL